jgi:hypothetical protein
VSKSSGRGDSKVGAKKSCNQIFKRAFTSAIENFSPSRKEFKERDNLELIDARFNRL